MQNQYKLDFNFINDEAKRCIIPLLQRILPGGFVNGQEYTVTNPTRADHKPGSFKINLTTGKWADFATGDAGGDFISLVAYLYRLSPYGAAQELARILGMGGAHD